MSKLVIVPAADLRQELLEMGFEVVYGPRDQALACPHVEYLAELFKWCFGPGYLKEAFDCDDFAMRAVTEASLGMAKAGVQCGHSILMCYVRIKEGCELNGVRDGSHATNLVKCVDGIWRFFEPQNGKVCSAQQAIDSGIFDALDFVLL